MENKYAQLAQLKSLLDSGALTQEEFDAAKKRILDSEDKPRPKESSTEDALPEKKGSSSSKKLPKWVIPAVIVAIVIIVVIIVSVSGSKGSKDSSYDVTEEIVGDTICVLEGEDYEPIDGLTLGNPWRKDYFKNEWGEKNENSPMIYTILTGTGWDIHIDYVPPTEESRWGLFRLYLVDEDGKMTNSSGPVTIQVRNIEGDTDVVEVTGTRDGVTFIEDPTSIEILKHYLDQETFDIRVEFEKYNERHATQARWEIASGSFQEAIDKLL